MTAQRGPRHPRRDSHPVGRTAVAVDRRPQPTVQRGHARLAALAVLVAVGLAQGADLVTFLQLMIAHGPAAELNPIVRAGVTDLGLVPVVIAKLALIVLVVATFVIVARTRARLGLFVATAATTAGLIGAFSNVIAL